MKRHLLLLLLTLLIITYSCKEKTIAVENPISKTTNDSTLLVMKDSLQYIHIGKNLTPSPYVSQTYQENGRLYYIFLDDNDLNIFDYKTGLQKKRVTINPSEENGCGTLNNYSGFYHHSPDSIFVYNYKLKNLYLIDSLSKIREKWQTINPNLAKYPVDIEALTPSPISYVKGSILLSGSSSGQPGDATEENKPVSCIINLEDGALSYSVGYPNQYREANFGGLYFNIIYHTVDFHKDSPVYSFPIDHNIYKYNADFSTKEEVYAGSRYISKITSSPDNYLDLFLDKNKRIEYYVKQPSYANIIYDKYRKVYYRIAKHPLHGWQPSDPSFQKPFSIITINDAGNIISETSVFMKPKQFNLGNMHVTPEGLIIQKYTENEDVIGFQLFTLNN